MAVPSVQDNIYLYPLYLKWASDFFLDNRDAEGKEFFQQVCEGPQALELRVYKQMWKLKGRPAGNPEYGRNAFRGEGGLSSTPEEKVQAINKALKHVDRDLLILPEKLVHNCLWIMHGRPEGDPNYGREAFYNLHNRVSSMADKLAAARMSLNEQHLDESRGNDREVEATHENSIDNDWDIEFLREDYELPNIRDRLRLLAGNSWRRLDSPYISRADARPISLTAYLGLNDLYRGPLHNYDLPTAVNHNLDPVRNQSAQSISDFLDQIPNGYAVLRLRGNSRRPTAAHQNLTPVRNQPAQSIPTFLDQINRQNNAYAAAPPLVHAQLPAVGNQDLGPVPNQPLQSIRSFSELLSIADRAEVKLSFWGGISLDVPGYEEIISVDDLAKRILDLLRKMNYEFSESDRAIGKRLGARIDRLYHSSDRLLSEGNCFSRVLFYIRNGASGFLNYLIRGSRGIRHEWHGSYGTSKHFDLYTTNQFESVFNISLLEGIRRRLITVDRYAPDAPVAIRS